MKTCTTCGVSLNGEYSYTVCPRCLLAAALEPRPEAGAADQPAPENQGLGRWLQVRKDFFRKYELLEKIGGGGQGNIWRAWDFEFRREVAMKRLGGRPPHTGPAAYRFLAEAQITSQLDHPGILPVLDVGLDPDSRLFYTTPLLPGTTFSELWRSVQSAGSQGKTLNRALEWLMRVCEILAHAHSRGVIHRDLKPSNVLVGKFGEIRVIDWGSAQVLEAKRCNFEEPFVRLRAQPIETDRSEAMETTLDSEHATAVTGLPLTIAYAAPELLRGDEAGAGPAADIYSLGVMLYELLAGTMPYADRKTQAQGRAGLKDLILAGPPTPIRAVNSAVSRDLAAVCQKAMARHPDQRYASAEALADDLRAFLAIRPVEARKAGPLLIAQKWMRRNQAYVFLGGAAVVMLAIAWSVAHGFKVQRDSARQIQDVREAELAARSGRWREAIQHWDAAADHGYGDAAYLGLRKSEALDVLAEHDQAEALLARLAGRSDLGSQRAAVLLRLGTLELSDRAKTVAGLKLVQDAMALGLSKSDQLFAQGLLAESTPAALDLFHEALRNDPYDFDAHASSLGLELLLGRHQDLTNHIAVFQVFFPDDPLPGVIAVIEASVRGDTAGVDGALAALRPRVPSNYWQEVSALASVYAAAAKFYDVGHLLEQSPPARSLLESTNISPFVAGMAFISNTFEALNSQMAELHIPWLRCLQNGITTAGHGMQCLWRPYFGDQAKALREIDLGWKNHPEAAIPLLSGMILENQETPSGPLSENILAIQAHLYQMAADSPSIQPKMIPLARYLAARTEFELWSLGRTNSLAECAANLRRAIADPETSAAECHACLPIALGIGDLDLAYQFVGRAAKLDPDAVATQRDQIQVELAAGALAPALARLDQMLAKQPDDAWALAERRTAWSRAKAMMNSNSVPARANL